MTKFTEIIPQAGDFISTEGGLSSPGFRYLSQQTKIAKRLNELDEDDAYIDEISGQFSYPEETTETIILDAKYARTITAISVKTAAGTATVTPKIGSTTLGGGANSATTSKSTVAHSEDNAMAIGDSLTFVISSVSADCQRLSFTIKFTRAILA